MVSRVFTTETDRCPGSFPIAPLLVGRGWFGVSFVTSGWGGIVVSGHPLDLKVNVDRHYSPRGGGWRTDHSLLRFTLSSWKWWKVTISRGVGLVVPQYLQCTPRHSSGMSRYSYLRITSRSWGWESSSLLHGTGRRGLVPTIVSSLSFGPESGGRWGPSHLFFVMGLCTTVKGFFDFMWMVCE